ncbi:MAG: hypothetical protein C0404_01900 [Verrucomicrobia bacterium]|nr:hypothetical protein [Verrucomicrobiota bacterium]
MRLGVCCSVEQVNVAKDAGCDYFEGTVVNFLKPLEAYDAVKPLLAQVKAASLPCEALAVFLPKGLSVTGPAVDMEALRKYATVAFERAEEIGVKVIVFGSGGARQIPDGFDREKAYQQMTDICKMFGPLAEKRHITLCIEHLRKTETNMVNTIAEAMRIVKGTNHPAVQLLVDSYHWAAEGGTAADVETNAAYLKHMHCATLVDRRPPLKALDNSHVVTCIKAAKSKGYNARVSIEAKFVDFAKELPEAMEILKGI